MLDSESYYYINIPVYSYTYTYNIIPCVTPKKSRMINCVFNTTLGVPEA